MRRRKWHGITVVALVICGLTESAPAYYSSRQGRFLSRDPIGEQGGLNLYSYTRNSPPARYDPLGQDDQPNPAPPDGGWRRRLHKGPYGIDGKDPGYQIHIFHIPPPTPPGATQYWQVFSCIVAEMDDRCMPYLTSKVITDVGPLGGRKEFEDKLKIEYTVNSKKHVCYAFELCTATVGFDNGTPVAERQSFEETIPGNADRLISNMRLPSSYQTVYGFVKRKQCCSCMRRLLGWAHVPDGEWLAVGGVGSWHSP